MRIVRLALATTILIPLSAQAADFDPGPLRGTQYAEPGLAPVMVWQGGYIGGFGGYGLADFRFDRALKNIAHDFLRNDVVETEYGVSSWLKPKNKDGRDTVFGAFAGYNWQYDEAVLGIEVDYTHGRLKGSGSDHIGRFVTTSNGFYNLVDMEANATNRVSDYGTLRVRAGYTSGAFLPFITAGVALARIDTTGSLTLTEAGYDAAALKDYPTTGVFPNTYGYYRFLPTAPTQYDCADPSKSCLAAPRTLSRSKSTVAGGLTGGIGVDIALAQNIFLRGEYQYIYFDDFDGNKFSVNTVRAAAGLKF